MTKIKFSFTSAAPEIFVIVSASLSKVCVVRRDTPKVCNGPPHSLDTKGVFHSSIKGEKSFLKVVKYCWKLQEWRWVTPSF